MNEKNDWEDKIHRFNAQGAIEIELPELFTFPFYYTPHPIAVLASEQLQEEILSKGFDGHNFGLDPDNSVSVIGKMFGVLVVRDSNNELGFLAAFSGKLASSNHHDAFVPPVYDILDPNGFFLTEEQRINEITLEIARLESNPNIEIVRSKLQRIQQQADEEIGIVQKKINVAKKRRKAERKIAVAEMSIDEYGFFHETHVEQSLMQQAELRELKQQWNKVIDSYNNDLLSLLAPIEQLKEERKLKSSYLQSRLFNEYSFLNINQTEKSLNSIFQKDLDISPPAGSGECAAPKLMQYAFLHGLQPIALAEFWWGASPNSEIRSHKSYYPSCRSKCEPILKHMLSGMEVMPNPMLKDAVDFDLDIIYEDDSIIVINKPTEVLSVPGKTIEMSILYKLRLAFPEATGPLLVHRLDMSTSGILLAAKNKHIHKDLQAQFMKRSVSKRYVAVLNGIVDQEEGIIDLPLRVDLDNRPRQLICYEYGKRAVTKYKVIDTSNGFTRIHLFPITGRTHQLRVHVAHSRGLNCPIVGDDLYGTTNERLLLHAEELRFMHPETKENLTFVIPAPF